MLIALDRTGSETVSLFRFVTDATVSLLVSVLLFVLPSEPPYYLCCWKSCGSGEQRCSRAAQRFQQAQSGLCVSVQPESQASPGPAPPLLTWQVTQKKMPWNIVLLLGGGFALAKGSEVKLFLHFSILLMEAPVLTFFFLNIIDVFPKWCLYEIFLLLFFWLSGVRPVPLARCSDDPAALHPPVGHRHHHLPPYRHLH